MKTNLLILVLLASAAFSDAADKPTIYNHVTGEESSLDRTVKAALAPKFSIVDIRDSPGYVGPKATAGGLPTIARTQSGELLSGYVLVAYVVTKEGRASEPVILKTTDERLNSISIKAMDEWRYAPAKLDDAAIATTAAQEFNFKIEVAPSEFVSQVLEPTGGKIARPKGWFYTESHREHSYTWILSREEATKEPYTTGVRIQTIVDVKKGTGKSARQFVLDFVASKKKESVKVIKACDEKDQGLFTRICLETEEGPHHILYSLFWGNKDLDVVVVSIAGTTKDLWDIYSPTFDKMSSFELIDMKRFEK